MQMFWFISDISKLSGCEMFDSKKPKFSLLRLLLIFFKVLHRTPSYKMTFFQPPKIEKWSEEVMHRKTTDENIFVSTQNHFTATHGWKYEQNVWNADQTEHCVHIFSRGAVKRLWVGKKCIFVGSFSLCALLSRTIFRFEGFEKSYFSMGPIHTMGANL